MEWSVLVDSRMGTGQHGEVILQRRRRSTRVSVRSKGYIGYRGRQLDRRSWNEGLPAPS